LKEISRIQSEMGQMVVSHILKEKTALNREQQEKFRDIIQGAGSSRRTRDAPQR
jgi:hypothetical protein